MTCGRDEMKRFMQFRTQPRKLPVVFSVEEVSDILMATPGPGLKYRAALSISYGPGTAVNRSDTSSTLSTTGSLYGLRRNSMYRWRAETQQSRGQKSGQRRTEEPKDRKTTDKCQKRGSQRQKQEAPKRPTPPGSSLRAKYLRVLGLEPGRSYSPEEIKKAYRRKAKETHPDGGGTAAAFIEVQKAYEWLAK